MESLTISNGIMTPKYDEYNDLYSVNIDSDVSNLEIDYRLKENEILNIYGNLDFEEKNNKVILTLNDQFKVRYITLLVNKNKTVTNNIDDFSYLEIDKNYVVPSYAPYLIGLSCFSIILLIFCLFYIRKRKN